MKNRTVQSSFIATLSTIFHSFNLLTGIFKDDQYILFPWYKCKLRFSFLQNFHQNVILEVLPPFTFLRLMICWVSFLRWDKESFSFWRSSCKVCLHSFSIFKSVSSCTLEWQTINRSSELFLTWQLFVFFNKSIYLVDDFCLYNSFLQIFSFTGFFLVNKFSSTGFSNLKVISLFANHKNYLLNNNLRNLLILYM